MKCHQGSVPLHRDPVSDTLSLTMRIVIIYDVIWKYTFCKGGGEDEVGKYYFNLR